MTDGYVPLIGSVLTHGPWIAGAASLAVIPGGFFLVAALLERRLIIPRGEFTAVAYGDPLLAVAIGLGVWLLDGAHPRGLATAPFGTVSLTAWLLFGMWQWRAELSAGFYTRAQALAPTKIWHQVIVYPLLGYWSWTAVLGGVLTPRADGPAVAAKIVSLCCVGAWMCTNLYDRRHPKLGHPPYDWGKLKPLPLPWEPESVTLRAALPPRQGAIPQQVPQ